MSIQVCPSAERCAVNVLFVRVSFTQCGATKPVASVLVLAPSVSMRRWNETPLDGVTTTIACLEPGARLSRIITPALAQPSLRNTLSMRAMIDPSPLRLL